MFPAGAQLDKGGALQSVLPCCGSAVVFLWCVPWLCTQLLPRETKMSKSLLEEQSHAPAMTPSQHSVKNVSNNLTLSQQAVTYL